METKQRNLFLLPLLLLVDINYHCSEYDGNSVVVFIWHQSAPMLLFDINQNRTDYNGNENNRSNQLSKAGTEASNLRK